MTPKELLTIYKNFAVIGVTPDKSKYGYKIYKRLKEKGYVHINASVRADVSLGLPKDIITLGMNGTPDTVNVNSYKVDVPFSMNAYLDLNGGYSEKINEKWKEDLKKINYIKCLCDDFFEIMK